jgi:hypothetical protein
MLPNAPDADMRYPLSNTYQSVLLPGNALLLVRIGIREALHLTSLATEKTVQVGSDLVAFTLLQCVALGASGLRFVNSVRRRRER